MLSYAGDLKAESSVEQMLISVRNISGVQSLRPVTGGIPLAQGVAAEGFHFGLHDENGKGLPLQTSILSRWKDGSARWVLLDFQAEPSPKRSYVSSLTFYRLMIKPYWDAAVALYRLHRLRTQVSLNLHRSSCSMQIV